MKWRLIITFILVTLSGSFFINACRKGQEDVPGKTALAFTVPAGFPAPLYDFSKNPLTEEGFQLGKMLFYDGRLSKDGNYPCASCHHQVAVFGTYDHDLSHGYNDQHSNRNASPLFNLAWKDAFHADGKYKSLEEECLDPIQAPNQMAEEIGNVLTKLRSDDHTRHMFNVAFGTEEITIERMQKALAQFTVSMITANSKYDQVKRGVNAFTDYEQRGYALYKTNCASCHPEPMFTDYSYRNIGLSIDPDLKDYGRFVVTGKKEDSLKFRVPSLRNVSITFPYMHDGRYKSLKACVEHYANNVQQSSTLDPSLVNGIHFTSSEIIDLVAFLRALTDSTLTKDLRFYQAH
ncbi:MAG TPA: cytochrome c peroxidase [Chitinophagaceae bacterium]|nr:cytochrome c peroxidase [Chitinophagaceae bacterium]